MAVRITSMVVRVTAIGVLILGALLWTGNNDQLKSVHMLFGMLIVLGLWGLGITQAIRGGSPVLAVVAVVLGGVAFWFGTNQESFSPNSNHWVIQVMHLLIGLGAIGLAEVSAARYHKVPKA